MNIVCWLLVVACCLVGEGSSQALNRHINPLWVESGRALLARTQGTAAARGLAPPPYTSTSLFYLDGAGQLRPVFLGDPQQLYSGNRFLNGNVGLGETNLYQGIQQGSSYIK